MILVNIKMYPEFEHGLAMALGDEFEENNINAYQLADFADTCQLPRLLVAKRLKYLIGKLTVALQEEISLILINDARILAQSWTVIDFFIFRLLKIIIFNYFFICQ